LDTKAGLAAVEAYTTARPRALDRERAAAVRRLAQRLRLAVDQAEELARQIRARAQAGFVALTRRCGVNRLTAGALAGLLGPGHRFRTEAQLAAYAGAAPLEASSAERVRHRLNRGGNRRLNALLYRIALTQARCSPAAQAYLARRAAAGKTRREALRARKRFLIRAVWRLWRECQPGLTEGVALTVGAAA
jgi:transposase